MLRSLNLSLSCLFSSKSHILRVTIKIEYRNLVLIFQDILLYFYVLVTLGDIQNCLFCAQRVAPDSALGNLKYQGSNLLVLHEKNLVQILELSLWPDFFNLLIWGIYILGGHTWLCSFLSLGPVIRTSYEVLGIKSRWLYSRPAPFPLYCLPRLLKF